MNQWRSPTAEQFDQKGPRFRTRCRDRSWAWASALQQLADAAGEGGAFLDLGLVGEGLATDVLVVAHHKDGGMGWVGSEMSDVAEQDDVGAVLAGATGPVDPRVFGKLPVTGIRSVGEDQDPGLVDPGREFPEQGMQLAQGIGELFRIGGNPECIPGATDPIERIDQDGARVGVGEDIRDAGHADRTQVAEGIGEGRTTEPGPMVKEGEWVREKKSVLGEEIGAGDDGIDLGNRIGAGEFGEEIRNPGGRVGMKIAETGSAALDGGVELADQGRPVGKGFEGITGGVAGAFAQLEEMLVFVPEPGPVARMAVGELLSVDGSLDFTEQPFVLRGCVVDLAFDLDNVVEPGTDLDIQRGGHLLSDAGAGLGLESGDFRTAFGELGFELGEGGLVGGGEGADFGLMGVGGGGQFVAGFLEPFPVSIEIDLDLGMWLDRRGHRGYRLGTGFGRSALFEGSYEDGLDEGTPGAKTEGGIGWS